MCHLNFLVRKQGYELNSNTVSALLGFMMGVTSTSYQSNSDADGVYFSNGTLVKQKNKINYFRYRKELILSNTIMAHQRISTSGKEMIFSQPFRDSGFVFAHNGIATCYEGKGNSDTYNMFVEFIKQFNLTDKRWKRDNRVKTALEHMLSKMSRYGNTYSCGLYDTKTGALYYFKNTGRNIVWYFNNDLVYITTSFSNDKFLGMLRKETMIEYKVEPDILYKVLSTKDRVEIHNLGKVDVDQYRPKTVVYKKLSHVQKVFNSNKGIEGIEKLFDKRKSVLKEIKRGEEYCRCDFCTTFTNNKHEELDMFVCDDCLEENWLEDYIEELKGQKLRHDFYKSDPYNFNNDLEMEDEEE